MLESIHHKTTIVLMLAVLGGCGGSGEDGGEAAGVHKNGTSIYDFVVNDIDGASVSLSTYRGKVLMMVNVASKCGATPQYAQLQDIYDKYNKSGFLVLGFPANNFGNQEPGSNEEIKRFCAAEYKVTFPLFSKISVKGEDIHPIYKFLTEEETNPDFMGQISWNFNKFLLGRDGRVLNRFPTNVKPDAPEVLKAIEQALAQQ